MRSAQAGKPVVDFQRPETVVSVSIDPTTGKLAAPDCPTRIDELFIAGTEPGEYCPKHGGEALTPPLKFQPISSANSVKPDGVEKESK
jgi:membrane carboxypeptidase/penicillin-binding protein